MEFENSADLPFLSPPLISFVNHIVSSVDMKGVFFGSVNSKSVSQ